MEEAIKTAPASAPAPAPARGRNAPSPGLTKALEAEEAAAGGRADADLDLAGLPGFMSVGDIVYTADGLACEVLRADLGPSQAHAGRVTIMYTVGKPELTTLPFGAEYLTSRKKRMPSTSLTFEPPPRLG